MQKLAPSSHHVVPGSLGGTGHSSNLVDDVACGRHSDFHQWATNRLPDQNIRLVAINSVGSDECIHPEVLEGVLTSVRIEPNELYVPEAFHQVLDQGAILKSMKALSFTVAHWTEELHHVRRTLLALTDGNKTFSPAKGGKGLNNHFLDFWSANGVPKGTGGVKKNVARGIQDLLEEKTNNKWTWVNSLENHVRLRLIACVKGGKSVKTSKFECAFIDIFKTHESKLQKIIEIRTEEQRKIWQEVFKYLPE